MMNYDKAIDYIKKCFPSILLRAHHYNMLEFSLPTNDIPLSKIFSYLDNAKTILNLQDYTISQTTLDQVFVNFASQESRDSLLDKKRLQDKQYLNDLKLIKLNDQLQETKFNDDQLESSTLTTLKQTPIYSSSIQFNNNHHNYLKQQQFHSNSYLINHHNHSKKYSSNHLINLNTINQLNHFNKPFYFNSQQTNQKINNLKSFHSYPAQSQITNHNPFLNSSSNIYCSIGRPAQLQSSSNNILYNTVQQSNNEHNIQPLIILPNGKRKK